MPPSSADTREREPILAIGVGYFIDLFVAEVLQIREDKSRENELKNLLM